MRRVLFNSCFLWSVFALNFALHAQETFVASFKGETAITSRPGNSNIIVGASNDYSGNEPRSASHRTINGGYTSTEWITVSLPLPSGKDASADPTVDFDADGNVYYCFTAYETEGLPPHAGGVYLCKSIDNGQTWQTPIAVHLPGSGQHDDKPWMVIDRVRNPNRVYVAWSRVNSNGTQDLLFSYAPTNNLTTNTFSSNLETLRLGSISGNDIFINHGAAIAVRQNGANPPLYVAWVEDKVKAEVYSGNASTIFLRQSNDGGDTFLSTTTVKSNFNSATTAGNLGSIRPSVFRQLLLVRPPTMFISRGVKMAPQQEL